MPVVLFTEVDRDPDPLFRAGIWLQASLGVVLAVGGVGLWRRRMWGATAVVFVIRVLMAYVILFHAYFAVEATRGGGPGLIAFLVAMAVIFAALWWAILKRGVAYVTEPAFRSLLE